MPNIFSDDYIEIKDDPFIIDMMYANNTNNMTGIETYNKIGLGNRAFVHIELWKKLKNVIPYLKEKNLKMKICDAYRPPIAHEIMKKIIPTPGYFAADPARSPHCRAIAIDVCLCHPNGTELKYPTKVDAYTPYYAKKIQSGDFTEFEQYLKKVHHDYQDPTIPEEIKNRNELRTLMENAELKILPIEWWHYNLADREHYTNYPIVEFD